MITTATRYFRGMVLVACCLVAPVTWAMEVSYTVAVVRPTTGLIDVTVEIRNASGASLDIAMPAWTPGGYGLMWWVKNVQQLHAEDGAGRVLAARQVDTSQWRISPLAPMVKVRYKLYVPKRLMDDIHVKLMGPSTFMYVVGESPYPAAGPVTLHIEAPEGWVIATGLERLKPGVYTAPDYDTFIDAPIEIADHFDRMTFKDHGANYDIFIRNAHNYDRDNFSNTIKHIVSELAEMMGGAPYDRYVFLMTGQNRRGGGLEHLNSTNISFKRYDSAASSDYRRLIYVIAHEVFHAWNVKRIRPSILGPFDYSRPQHTRNLYISEGITSYYGMLTLARQGIWTREVFYEELSKEIKSLQTSPGRLITSAEDASWNAWITPGNKAHTFIDFYTKGNLLGLLLDMEIRERTNNRKNLDDVFRRLLAEYGLPKPGFPEDGLQSAVEAVTVEGKGDSEYTQFFADYIAGVVELDYDRALKQVGLKLEITRGDPEPSLGLETEVEGSVPVVSAIDFDGAAYKAGIMPRDILLTVAGERVVEQTFASRLKSMQIGDEVDVMVMRDDRILTISLILETHRPATYKIIEDPQAFPGATAVGNAWLKPYAPPFK
ncbi:MAG: PDZ domain-containing protein [Gemmatimonadota bacterium]|nr:PDZ domain-containing protein [Gemmatimonadota bacterium]